MPKQNVGVRLPDELLQAIDARCKTSGLSRTDVVVALIQQGLEKQTALAEEVTNQGELSKKYQP